MINFFNVETAPLSESEKKLIPGFVKHLRNHVGARNAITSSEIIKAYNNAGIKLTGARIRKIMNHIRTKDLVFCVIASSKGYYISEDPAEYKQYIESLDQRIKAIGAVRDAMIKQGYNSGLMTND